MKDGEIMKEIKYRAWDKEYRRMFEHDYLMLAYKGIMKAAKVMIPEAINAPTNALFLPLGDPNMIFMQFSRLKDNRERDIYEGDYCKLINASGWTGYGVVEFHDGCFEIIFKEPLYDVKLGVYRQRDYLKCWTVNHAVEVIGNIYENPELMEGWVKC